MAQLAAPAAAPSARRARSDVSCSDGTRLQRATCDAGCSVVFRHPFHGDPEGRGPDDTAVWEGETLSVDVGACQPADGSGADATWLRDGTPIARGSSYTVTAADVGALLSVRVVLGDAGQPRVVTRSLEQPAAYHAPVQTSPPTIAGTLRVGQSLSAAPGRWHLAGAAPGPIHYDYVWVRDAPFPGPTLCRWEVLDRPAGRVLKLTAADVGHHIGVVAFASNGPGGPLPPAASDCGLYTASAGTVSR